MKGIKSFGGSMTAIVTPFCNGKFDGEVYKKLINWQIEERTTGLVFLGTTGESPTVSFAEHSKIIEFAVRAVDGRVPVIAGTGANSTEEAIMLTQQAESVGADACLSVVPYYNKPSQQGLYLHFRMIAEKSSNFPIILYDVPGRTGVGLDPATVVRLAEIPNVIGIKSASGDMRKASDFLRMCPKNFLVFSGDDFTSFALMMLGGAGGISVTSNIVPDKVAEFWREGLAGNWERARKIHFELELLNQALFLESNPIMVKAALAMMKKIALEYRLPMCEPSGGNHNKLEEILVAMGLI